MIRPLRSLLALLLLVTGCDGPQPATCSSANCLGCCDDSGQCQFGKADVSCGVAGQQCQACGLGTHCAASGFCDALFTSTPTPQPQPQPRPDAGQPDAGTSVSTTPGSTCAGTTTRCGTTCRDLSTDENNCGACGRECMAGLVCSRGSCQVLPSDCTTTPCPGDFGCNPETRHCTSGCFANSDCRGDAVCSSGVCRCGPSEAQCGNVCARTSSPTSCACPSGYEAHGGDCVDVDECARGTHSCPSGSVCINAPGSWDCECPPGFIALQN